MAAIIQRPLRGSRISTFYPVKNLPSLSSLDSAFQLQEYISLLIRLDVHDVDAIVSLPSSTSKDSGKEKESPEEEEEQEEEKGDKQDKDGDKAKNEVTVDESCWIYEQLRRLAQDLTHPLITTLQQECTRASCPEMKAGEWLYLCVAHGNEGSMEQCCAIDYILHTVDSATALLNSPRAFPSRLQIPATSHRHFSSLARRLGRIFAHAYFHHREAFEQAEAESSLYARFLALTSKFDLVPSEFLVIPPEAFQGGDDQNSDGMGRDVPPPRLHAAALDPLANREGEKVQVARHLQPPQLLASTSNQRQYQQQQGIIRTKSTSPPGLVMEGSPRRFGRNRTDTMIFSEAEATSVAEELASRSAKGDGDGTLVVPEDLSLGGDGEIGVIDDEFEPSLKTAKPQIQSGETDGEVGIEISLTPDEDIAPSPLVEVVASLVEEKGEETSNVPKEEEDKKQDAKTSISSSTESQELVETVSSVIVEEKPEIEEPLSSSSATSDSIPSVSEVAAVQADATQGGETQGKPNDDDISTIMQAEEAPAPSDALDPKTIIENTSEEAAIVPPNLLGESNPEQVVPTSAESIVLDTKVVEPEREPEATSSLTTEAPPINASALESVPAPSSTAEPLSETDVAAAASPTIPQVELLESEVGKEAPKEGE